MLVCSPPISSWGVHNANSTAQDAALNRVVSLQLRVCAVDNFERTHSKNTSHTPRVLCLAQRERANALPFLSLVLIQV